jgi:hypothetical protein
LGVKVEGEEITPRKPIVSVAYAYKSFEADTANYARGLSGTVENADKVDGFHAGSTPTPGYLFPLDGSAKIPNACLYTGSGNGLDADLLDGQHASVFLSPTNDYGRSGVATDLYEGTSTLTSKYVNEGQTNSISSGMIVDNTIMRTDVSTSFKAPYSDTADYARAFSGTVQNADKVDFLHASDNPTPGYLYPLDNSAKIPNARLYTGSGNGLDADLLDGQHASAFALSGHNHDAVYLNDGAGEINATNDFNFPSPTFITNLDADKLDGQDASAFLSTANDYGRSGVATDLYEGTNTLTSKYVNEGQANSITSGMITDNQIVDVDISAQANIAPSKISGTAWTSSNDGSGSGLDADLLDGQHSSAFLSTANDYGRSGVATDLYEGTSTLTSKYVNEGQANSVTSGMITDNQIVDADISAQANISPTKISGTAWTSNNDGSGSGLDADLLDGLHSTSFLSTSNDYGRQGVATDLYEGVQTLSSKYSSTSHDHFGQSWTGTGPTIFNGLTVENNFSGNETRAGIKGVCYGSGTFPLPTQHAVGVFGDGHTSGNGEAVGGWFQAGEEATASGLRLGVRGAAIGASSNDHTGVNGFGKNTGNGKAFGGYFETYYEGTGHHYGVYSIAENQSSADAIGGYFLAKPSGTGFHLGVYGDARGSSNTDAIGVDGYASNSSTGAAYGGYFWTSASGTGTHYGVYAVGTGGSANYAGYFVGNFLATGGTKSAAVKVDNGEYRLLYCQESTENWFEDFGKAQLTNGVVRINIDPLYAQTVNTSIDYHVFPIPEGDCKGLFVTNKTPTSFEVRELQGGTSNISFSYRIVAKRKGYENLRLEKMAGPTPEEIMTERATHQAKLEKERAKMEEKK